MRVVQSDYTVYKISFTWHISNYKAREVKESTFFYMIEVCPAWWCTLSITLIVVQDFDLLIISNRKCLHFADCSVDLWTVLCLWNAVPMGPREF
ncbi:hypothetical protein AB205_0018120 [Aquarana catesbeiana]|uniref:Uncharacterized protein n=1 Tax=Aquarana catesbeiana TaxID=8400 RepID=A0A2G9RAD1_AQUCT|nr:hypothetical protein AB205_0018120 [Aquarana catesbeiana]